VRSGPGNAAAFGCFGFIGRRARRPGELDWPCGLGGQEQDCQDGPRRGNGAGGQACGPDPVAVADGANSTAQAALYLAGHGNAVTLIVRGNDLAAGMSSYLANRILAYARITVRTATKVTTLNGGSYLEAIRMHTAAPGDDPADINQPCRELFYL
jgi:hypothetical protein